MTNAPTTRETADHAELARLEDVADWFERGDPRANGSVLLSASVAAEHARDLRFFLSEIAALRGERDGLMATRRWNVIEAGPDLHVCDGDHEKSDRCDYQIFVPLDRATQAERQRDEAVGLLRLVDTQARVGHGGKPVMRSSRINLPATLWHQVRAFLANQGADQ